jgi:cyclic beta-1,2-glucan synthetase
MKSVFYAKNFGGKFFVSDSPPLPSENSPLRAYVYTRDDLAELGQLLAEQDIIEDPNQSWFAVTQLAIKGYSLKRRFAENVDLITRGYTTLLSDAKEQIPLEPGADWILDNFHVIDQHIREIKRFFPRGYDKTLPRLREGELAGFPRAYRIALELVTHTDASVDTDTLSALIEAYQQKQTLTMGEVWAIPIMLKFALIENLRRLVVSLMLARDERLHAEELIKRLAEKANPSNSPTSGAPPRASELLLYFAKELSVLPQFHGPGIAHLVKRLRERNVKIPSLLKWYEDRLSEEGIQVEDALRQYSQRQAQDQVSIGNSVTSLRLIAATSWRDWFEEQSIVHRTLLRDPSGVYGECDFKTRDLYRHIIEKYAQRSAKSERSLAETALSLASKNYKPEYASLPLRQRPSHCHVGYYFIGDGKDEFEKACTLQPLRISPLWSSIKSNRVHVFVGGLLLGSLLLSFLAAIYTFRSGGGGILATITLFLFLIPASELALHVLQWFIGNITSPRPLAKLSLEEGVPSEYRTLIVVHGIFTNEQQVQDAIDHLEILFLSNDLDNVRFALLADFADSTTPTQDTDAVLVEAATKQVATLNLLHCESQASSSEAFDPIFSVFFRSREWNESEQKFLCWERKRGKLAELNRLILDRGSSPVATTFSLTPEHRQFLKTFRFVLTLDGDAQLPHGNARKLIGALAHPLNRPTLDQNTRSVTSGYGLIIPRVAYSLTSANASLFARSFSGPAGLDPYTNLVSDFYMDVFGEASFVGKGIYDVSVFEHSLEGRVPENSLLSHDLFEGNYVRVGIASDVEIYDDFPSRYVSYAKRAHRWVRGDWQLLPWLSSKVPSEDGTLVKNDFSLLSRWKIFDNLRRSLVPPSLLLLLIASWTILPGNPLFWASFVIFILAFPVYTNLAHLLVLPPIGLSLPTYLRGFASEISNQLIQSLALLAFLPQQAYLMIHAIVVTLYRVLQSRRQLLEWQTALQTEKLTRDDLKSVFAHFKPGLLITVIALFLITIVPHGQLSFSFPVIALWLAAPIFARFLARPAGYLVSKLQPADTSYLTTLAYDTWRYFRDHLNTHHRYLIPDNLQLDPTPVVADRTSSTNIGFSLVATLSAYECGFETLTRSLFLSHSILDSVQKLEKYEGHLLNWYQTTSGMPLSPRYVSSVDSGNFVASLITLEQSLHSYRTTPLVPKQFWHHLKNQLTKLEGGIRNVDLRHNIATIISSSPPETILAVATRSEQLLKVLRSVSKEEQELAYQIIPELTSLEELLPLVSWTSLYSNHPIVVSLRTDQSNVGKLLRSLDTLIQNEPLTITTCELQLLTASHIIDSFESLTQFSKEAWEGLNTAVSLGAKMLQEMERNRTESIALSSQIAEQTDFKIVYDNNRHLLAVGYHVEHAKMDRSFYDLLASESRLSSYVAIAKGDLPYRHWFTLGRNLVESAGGKCLCSWTGTMFEYLMPLVYMKNYPSTLLSETYRAIVRAQQAYGFMRRVPWGISESAYSRVDYHSTYQYKAFGVPGLGLKRGLEEDLVISPYSTALALPILPDDSLDNLKALERASARGEYGFVEAIDYTSSRLTLEEKSHVVNAYFAHHQGMILGTLTNLLQNNVLQERFHQDQRIKALELLLHEKFPTRIPFSSAPHMSISQDERSTNDSFSPHGRLLTTPHTVVPVTHILSNRRLSSIIDNAGSGYSLFERDIAVTRWSLDASVNRNGHYIYIKDVESNAVWSTSYQPTLVESDNYEFFVNLDKVEFKRRDHKTFVHTEVTVAQEHDVEIRRVTITNLSPKKRIYELTSFGEVVIGSQRADAVHPAFSKMFVESDFLSDIDTIICSRRPRSTSESPLFLFHALALRACWGKTQFETSRSHFIGRYRSLTDPAALHGPLLGKKGIVLDPIFSLRTHLELPPLGSEVVTFVTGVTRSRNHAEDLANRYREPLVINRAFEMSWSQGTVELRNGDYAAKDVQLYQALGTAVLYPIPSLRGNSVEITKNRLTQSSLWRFGISGDVPLVLVKVADSSHIALVRQALLAHRYLRSRGMTFDLIILNDYDGGYLQELQNELDQVVRYGDHAQWVDKKGGIFLRVGNHLSVEERTLLIALSRVILDGGKGLLEEQILVDEIFARLPLSTAGSSLSISTSSVIDLQEPSLVLPELKEIELPCAFGGFTNDGKTFSMRVSPSSHTPLPWSNVIANPNFGTLVTESGGGYTWSENSRENRLTPWSNDPVLDSQGEVLYLRDPSTQRVWSATPQPCSSHIEFDVHHSFGATTFNSVQHKITSNLVVTVGHQESVKWWSLTLTNNDDKERTIEAFLYIDWILGVLKDDSSRTTFTHFDESLQVLYALNYYNNEFAQRVAYMGSSLDISSFTTDKGEFIGRNRSLANPIFFSNLSTHSRSTHFRQAKGSQNDLSGKNSFGVPSCGVIRTQVSLEPRSQRHILFFLGQASSVDTLRTVVPRVRSSKMLDQDIHTTKKFWDDLTSGVRVRTPHARFNTVMNGWLLYQAVSCRLWGRTGFYQSGGAFGFRDQLQDVLALIPLKPEMVRDQIILHASRQFVEGDVQHWWHPPTGRGVRTKISDDFLWLPFCTVQYLNASGDKALLDEQVPYIEGPNLDGHSEAYIVPHVSSLVGSIYDHCIRALDHGLSLVSDRGLAKIGAGDWNDGMNEVGSKGKGESIWLSWFLAHCLSTFAPLVEGRDKERAAHYRNSCKSLVTAIETHGWDGKWYRRAYFDDGSPLGSTESQDCQIDSIAQTWSVITGLGDRSRAAQALREVNERLVDTDHKLIKLLTPPFDKGVEEPGYIKGYVPGVRENGGQYTHAAAWLVIAVALQGDGNRAFELFDIVNPLSHAATEESVMRYQGEPYVLCGDVYGAAPHEGRAGWSWYTGSASWLYQAGLHSILGLGFHSDHMTLSPCIPSEWGEFEVDYSKNGTSYLIKVLNPLRVSKGVKRMSIDGVEVMDYKIPLIPDRGTIHIEVELGD